MFLGCIGSLKHAHAHTHTLSQTHPHTLSRTLTTIRYRSELSLGGARVETFSPALARERFHSSSQGRRGTRQPRQARTLTLSIKLHTQYELCQSSIRELKLNSKTPNCMTISSNMLIYTLSDSAFFQKEPLLSQYLFFEHFPSPFSFCLCLSLSLSLSLAPSIFVILTSPTLFPSIFLPFFFFFFSFCHTLFSLQLRIVISGDNIFDWITAEENKQSCLPILDQVEAGEAFMLIVVHL